MSQTKALLRIQYFRYKRAFGENLRQFFFPIIITAGIYFFAQISEGSNLIAIYMPWAYNGYARNIFVDIVNEKKVKSREYFKINGLKRTSYYASHMIMAILKGLVVNLILMIGFCFAGGSFIPWADMGLLFATLELQSIATTLISFTLSIYFDDPFIGSDIIGTLYGILGFLYFVGYGAGTPWTKYFCSLAAPAAMTLGILGTAQKDSGFNLTHGTCILVFDVLLYYLIFFLLDTFYGMDKETTSKYWLYKLRIRRKQKKKDKLNKSSGSIFSSSENKDFSSALFHEPFVNTKKLKASVQVEELRKNYGKIEILKGISVCMYEKQIFCLLGHNGAGKTTCINILTGFSKSTSGVVNYYGKNFKKFYDELKTKIGVCPQNDLCFPFMTCEENLETLAEIRGIPKSEIPAEVVTRLQQVGLYEDKDKLSQQLSGGNRRKLSMAMALLGGTEILYFDEPTSAMDPGSRRVIWQIIKQLRQEGKTIILTTHYLEEADELADRIGVMSNGNLFAVGSPNYIKKEFGVGYHLFISPKYDHPITEKFDELKPLIKKTVLETIAGSQYKEQSAEDVLKFSLPFSEQPNFASLFSKFEKEDGLVLNLEMNSLEDAFLRITIEDEKQRQTSESSAENIKSNPPASISTRATYNFWAQMTACFYKRFLITIRSPQGYFSIIQPIAFILTATVLPGIIKQNQEQKVASFVAFIAVGFTSNTSIYCGSTVYDREKKVKYALRVMGCRNVAYWIGTFLFDILVISCFACLLFLLVETEKVTFVTDHMGEFVLLMFFFISSALMTAYLWGFFYSEAITATSTYPVLALILLYLGPMILSAVFDRAGQGIMSTVCQIMGLILGPCLPFQQAMFAINPDATGSLLGPPLFSWSYGYIIILALQCVAYMILTLVIENQSLNLTSKRPKKTKKFPQEESVVKYRQDCEEDVKSENSRLNMSSNHDTIKVRNLKKVYPNGFKAIKKLSFGVESGQIFGLLGPNGAGKSTTFNIITQLTSKTDGLVELNGISIDHGDRFKIYSDCGVCPQFDPLWDLLTVKEHLTIFGRVKGLRGQELKENTEYFLEILRIKQHEDKKTFQLSGGNKRRLCVALASLGAPTMQFMDEPSTGLDPLARVYLWETIKQNVSIRRSAVILTTHSMTEAENLCSKIGIMINGQFVCLGSVPYLKNKYGSGYKITISRGPKCLSKEQLTQALVEVSPQIKEIEDESEIYDTYQVPVKEFCFSKAFEELEYLKKNEIIKDFSIYNTTLEQVFLDFSKHQMKEPAEHNPSRRKKKFLCFTRN